MLLLLLLRAGAEAVQEGDGRRFDERHHLDILCYNTAVFVGTSVGVGFFNIMSCGVMLRPTAERELIEYMVNAFTYPISGVIMLVKLWSSDISGSDVMDLLSVYFVNLAACAITILLALFLPQQVLGKEMILCLLDARDDPRATHLLFKCGARLAREVRGVRCGFQTQCDGCTRVAYDA